MHVLVIGAGAWGTALAISAARDGHRQVSLWSRDAAQAADMAAKTNYRNVGGMTIKGFELEAYYDSTYLFGSLSYSWITGKHEGAYTNPWGPDVWAKDIPAPKWITTLGVKIPSWDAKVGWQAHQLKVRVAAEHPVYRVREKAQVKIAVRTADGTALPADSAARWARRSQPR